MIFNYCPNDDKFRQLVDRIGYREAMGVWMEHERNGTTYDPMSYPRPRFAGDFEHIWREDFDGITQREQMNARIEHLRSTGARISNINSTGFTVSVSPVSQTGTSISASGLTTATFTPLNDPSAGLTRFDTGTLTSGEELEFKFTPEEEQSLNERLKQANELQKAIVNDVFVDVKKRIWLDTSPGPDGEPQHVYRDLNGNAHPSITTNITGEKDFTDPETGINPYVANTEWGNDIDDILRVVVDRKGYDAINAPTIPEMVKKEVFNYFTGLLAGLTSDGSIPLTQVIVHDPESGATGSIDLLLVTPQGDLKVIDLKTSWTSIHDRKYNTKHRVGEGSLLDNALLSKSQTQSIQVNSYRKILNLMGYNTSVARTEHILLTRNGNEITGWQPDTGKSGISYVEHDPSENETFVEKIVPTEYNTKNRIQELNDEFGVGNPANRTDFNNSPENVTSRQERSDNLEKRVIDIISGAIKWRDYLNDIKHRSPFDTSDQSLMKISNLIAAMEQEYEETKNYSRVFSVFLEYSEKHLDSILNHLNNPKNLNDNHSYIQLALRARDYINQFDGLSYVSGLPITAAQLNASNRVIEKTRNVAIAIDNAVTKNSEDLIQVYSVNPLYQDPNAVKAAVTGVIDDISKSTKMADTIGNSGIPILENASKLLASKREEVRTETHKLVERIQTVADKLIKVMGTTDPKKLYGWMRRSDGHLIGPKGAEYFRLQAEVNKALLDKEGNVMKPIEDPATPEDLEFNKRLYFLKEKQREFTQAEKTDSDYFSGMVSSDDGDYHRLTDKFKSEREKYMYQNAAQYGQWVPIDENNKEYVEWREKNMEFRQWIGLVTYYDKEQQRVLPTGETEKRSGWFPLPKNVEVREKSSKKTGSVQLIDETYRKLQNPGTDIEKVQKEYYDTYMDLLKSEIENHPPGSMLWFEKSFAPMVGANFFQQVAAGKKSFGSLLMNEITNFFKLNPSYKGEGSSQSLPLLFMGDLQNQEKVNRLKTLIAEHTEKKLTATNQREWLKEYKRLTGLLEAESNKLTADQLHPDLTEGLSAFIQMSQNFRIKSGIEDTMLAIKEQISKQQFKQGNKIVKGTDSRTLELYNHMMEVMFYHDPNFTESMWEVVGNRLMKLTSSISIPLNVFGMINNRIVARINNRIDAWGDALFKQSSYNRMLRIYNSDHIPNFAKSMGEHMLSSKSYKERKPASKFEALAREFNMVRHQKSGEGRVDLLARIGGYSGYEAGEWEVQSLVGNAILDSIQMGYTGTDSKLQPCSVYDAHTFDSTTGKLALKPGYVYLDNKGNVATDQIKQKHFIINRIHETNDRIHGNYDPANKIMLERTLAGKMILQFHKWVYPNFKQRYQKGKFDENLGGGTDIEGRYNTLWNFTKAFIELGNLTDRWEELTDFQKANLKKDLADAMYIAACFAIMYLVTATMKGVGDDDPYAKKVKNWLLYESDRGLKEVSLFVPAIGLYESYQMVSQPFAAVNSLRNFAMLMHDITYYPFQPDSKNIYQRGNYKGSNKILIDLLRITPGGNTIRRWWNFKSVNTFYLGN